MAWESVTGMEKRVGFIKEISKKDRNFTEVCKEYEVSRKTGYKWLKRYQENGLKGLKERSRRPYRSKNKTSSEMVQAILEDKLNHLNWGPKKIRERLIRKGFDNIPSARTVANILARHQLVKPRKSRKKFRSLSHNIATRLANHANEIWAVDFKGWFKTKDGKRCDPLTITDLYSRYIIACQLVKSQKYEDVRPVFEDVFQKYGLPKRIRSDNGAPFATRGLGHLSQLSVWWMTLGIEPERIEPGKPQQNGQHERMHKTLKAEIAGTPRWNRSAQQKALDKWKLEFNTERPHEGIGMRYPLDLYAASSRRYEKLGEIRYPEIYETRKVDSCGHFYWRGNKIFFGEAFSRITLGLRRDDNNLYSVYFDKVHLADFNTKELNLMKRY